MNNTHFSSLAIQEKKPAQRCFRSKWNVNNYFLNSNSQATVTEQGYFKFENLNDFLEVYTKKTWKNPVRFL